MRAEGFHDRSALLRPTPFSQHSADVPGFQSHAGPVRRGLSNYGNIRIPFSCYPPQRSRLAHRVADMETQQEFIFFPAPQIAVPGHQGTQFFLKTRARLRRHAEEAFFRPVFSGPFQSFRYIRRHDDLPPLYRDCT